MAEIQSFLNPASWSRLTEDKSIFYRYCMALDIPVPELYAIFFKKIAGWAFNGSILSSCDDWREFFEKKIPPNFVIKPSMGVYGEGVNAFTKSDNKFTDALGRLYKAEELHEAMLSNPEYDRYIIQERLENHPELIRLSGIKSLQTVRKSTFVDSSGECHILHATLKLITGQNVVDNFAHAQTGNWLAKVYLENGVLGPAVTIAPNGFGTKTIATHPKTGVSIEGFRLPLWQESCRLIKETALKFLPIRTIGWDIALTPNGPVIIEGNMWWDPPNRTGRGRVLSDALEKDRGPGNR